jgi:uncharacterized protein with ParB-like and HNH nuclease domain
MSEIAIVNPPSDLEQQILRERNQLSTDRLDMSFGEIMSMYERGEVIIKPAFQRYFRWDEEQRTRFIESILLGIPIPPIFVAENGDGIWELVDGLQRISTILSFFGVIRSNDSGIKDKNKWKLEEGDRISALEGLDCDTLPLKFRLNIKRATCRIEIIRWNSNYDMRFELFNRLNTGGSPLTPQEIRNCIYRDISSKFNDFLKKLAELPEFLATVALSEAQTEQLYNEELVLRFVSLYEKHSRDIETSIEQHMTLFMKSALETKNFNYEKYELIFTRTFKILAPLGKEIFRQQDKKFATALYDVITIGVAENIDFYEKSPKNILTKIDNEVRKDATLLKFSRRGGNNQKTRIINRLKEGRRIFGDTAK